MFRLFVPQVYDLASPGESIDSAAGCRLTDGVCMTAAGPSCGVHASCLADWGSFSCECRPGYTGHKCERGEGGSVLDKKNHLQSIVLTFTPLFTL